MPNAKQKQGLGGSTSIAYSRWEPLNEDDNDVCDNHDEDTAKTNQVRFHHFEEDQGESNSWGANSNYSSVSTIPDINFPASSSSHKNYSHSSFTHKLGSLLSGIRSNKSASRYNWQRRPRWYSGGQKDASNSLSDKEIGGCTLTASPTVPRILPNSNRRLSRQEYRSSSFWNISIKLLAALVIFGIGWIVGFVVRWGVHHYYIDPKGHCITPRLYRYDPGITKYAMDIVNLTHIMSFFDEYTGNHGEFDNKAIHRVGTMESEKFAMKIAQDFRDFGLKQVSIDKINKLIPGDVSSASRTGSNALTIKNLNGSVMWTKSFNGGRSSNEQQVVYSADGVGMGPLVYGHYGRLSDLNHFKNNCGLNFTGAVVILKTRSSLYHVGSMVRNVELFGATAVVLFPDPNSYIITENGVAGNLAEDVTLSHSVKYVPGDPSSPYVEDISSNRSHVKPNIPVVSISIEDARIILANFTYAGNVSAGSNKNYWFGLPLNSNSNAITLNYKGIVTVNHNVDKNVTLNNVIATIPGRYEPTRYVIIGSHHDAFHEGASRPGVGHSVFMELVRTLSVIYKDGLWLPGRSIMFVSWDGEELGGLGSTSWLYRHSKELASRGLAYINLDYLLQGSDDIHIYSSPLLSDIITAAAHSVSCTKENTEDGNFEKTSHSCSLYDVWLQKYNSTNTTVRHFAMEMDASNINGFKVPGQRLAFSSGASSFENILGISSIDVTVKNRHSATGDGYPYEASSMDNANNAKTFLKFDHAKIITKFLVNVIMQLLDSAKLDLSATAYADDVKNGINTFLSGYADTLHNNLGKQPVKDLLYASKKFSKAAESFHLEAIPQPALQMLGHHEFNDQLMELERAFLLPPFASLMYDEGGSIYNSVLSTSPFRHLIHGPSPLNVAHLEFLPRLSAAIQIAQIEDSETNWKIVQKEIFYVVDALESASCVLSNHLIQHIDE